MSRTSITPRAFTGQRIGVLQAAAVALVVGAVLFVGLRRR